MSYYEDAFWAIGRANDALEMGLSAMAAQAIERSFTQRERKQREKIKRIQVDLMMLSGRLGRMFGIKEAIEDGKEVSDEPAKI